MRMRALALAAVLLITLQAQAAETIIDIPHGSTSVVLPDIQLLSIDTTPEGAIAETGITNATAGLQIKVRADVSNGWHAEHSQASGTINAITGTIGQFETPDANDVHFEEVATGAGAYQLILPDSYYALDDGTTDCGGAACAAKSLTILIRDSSSPTFADKWVRVGLNVESTAAAVDAFFDEPCTDHQTAGTLGNACFSTIPGINTTVNGHTSQLTNIQALAGRTALYAAAVSAVTDQQNFVVDSGDDPGSTNAHAGKQLCIVDSDDASVSDCQRITAYNTSTDTWTIAAAPAFTVEVGDSMFIAAANALAGDIAAAQSDLNIITGDDGVLIDADEETAIANSIMSATVDGSIDVACYFAVSLAYSSGKWTRSGDVVTYRNPGDTANRLVVTIQDPGRDTITITCP